MTEAQKTRIGIACLFLVVLLMFALGALSQRAYKARFDKVYNACIADGKPSYYCQAVAREATR